jgi:hypothetical protein
MSHRKEVRVFISSPGDCSAERDAVTRVLNEMNTTVGDREKLFFQAVRWEDLAPGLGNPQTVIDEHLGAYNLLVGIMWMRFGTPIPGGAGSGTEHEVQQAMESWTRVGEPRVMFYFKQDPPKDLSEIDTSQLQKVQEFKQRLQAAALVQTFHGTSEFESKLRLHLHKLIDYLRSPVATSSNSVSAVKTEPYDGFHESFREVVGALSIPETGSMLHVVFGSIADTREMPVVIPVGQAFDFWQRGPRSVLASFENIRVGGDQFFDQIDALWPVAQRPKAAGLGHTKYLPLPENSQRLPGVFFVVTTRDLSTDADHYGVYTHTPIEGIDYIIDRVIDAAKRNQVKSLALPLLGTGYANVRRTMDDAKLGQLLQQTVTLLAIQKLEDALKDQSSTLRRAVVVVFSRYPQGQEEHDLWAPVTRFLGGRSEQRKKQLEQLLSSISELCT